MYFKNGSRNHDLADAGSVVECQKANASVTRIDHTHRVDDARKPLLAVGRFNARQRHCRHRLQVFAVRVVRMAAEIKPERRLLEGERFQQFPGPRIEEQHMIHARFVAKQIVLRDVGLRPFRFG